MLLSPVLVQYEYDFDRWGSDIQEGVFDMMELMVDFVGARMAYEPVPVDLLDTLALVWLFIYDCLLK